MPVALGPDFLCIGMMKTGTGWLFDQLQYHPDFWMPPVKEVHYLDRNEQRGVNAKKILDTARNKPKKLERIKQSARRPWDERDFLFLEEMAGHRGGKPDIALYASLFRHKNGKLSGDVTPHYGGLDEETIADVARGLPDARGVLLIRDPVARAWSAISMQKRLDAFDVGILDNADRFRDYLRSNKVRKLSFPTQTLARWQKHAPRMKIATFFFDDIAERPAEVRRDILNFLGADPEKASGEIAAGYNKKSQARKMELTDDIKTLLVEHFRDELRACAAAFGGHAGKWAANYGV